MPLTAAACLTAYWYFNSPFYPFKKALRNNQCAAAVLAFKALPVLNKKIKIKKIAGAQTAALQCEAAHPKEAAFFYEYLLQQNVLKSQKIIFHQSRARAYARVQDYKQALSSYGFLKTADLQHKNHYIFQMAAAYFKLQNWKASLKIINEGLSRPLEPFQKPPFLFLKARALFFMKKYHDSRALFLQLKTKNKPYFKQNEMNTYLQFIEERVGALPPADFPHPPTPILPASREE